MIYQHLTLTCQKTRENILDFLSKKSVHQTVLRDMANVPKSLLDNMYNILNSVVRVGVNLLKGMF